MNDQNENLSPEERIEQENFLLKSKIITQGGIFSENPESGMDPEIENIFLKRIMAFEEAEYKPVSEIIGVDPVAFPPAHTLSKDQIDAALKKLIMILDEHGIAWGLKENLPAEVAYRFLTEDYLLSEAKDLPIDFGWTIDGCSGDCPSCFQADYCHTKDDIWLPDELDAERKRRQEEDIL
jgi:hypothetical protein